MARKTPKNYYSFYASYKALLILDSVHKPNNKDLQYISKIFRKYVTY